MAEHCPFNMLSENNMLRGIQDKDQIDLIYSHLRPFCGFKKLVFFLIYLGRKF